MPSRPILAVAALLLAASGARAQVLPGASMDSPGDVRARFMETVLAGVREPLEEWGEAWSAGDEAALAAVYTEDAYLVTSDGAMVTGRDGIRGHLARHPDRFGPMELFLQDADASHRMVMTLCRYVLEPGAAGLGAVREEGSVMSVWIQQGRTWRIRAQVFNRER